MGAARLDRGCGRSLGVAWRAVKRFAEARRKATGRGRVDDPEGAAGAGREGRPMRADRIQARAIRRCGQLLREIEPSKGGQLTHDGRGISRSKSAKTAGLSERQKVTALRVANVPADEFEAAVESEHPPTVTKLAERGQKRRFWGFPRLRGRLPNIRPATLPQVPRSPAGPYRRAGRKMGVGGGQESP